MRIAARAQFLGCTTVLPVVKGRVPNRAASPTVDAYSDQAELGRVSLTDDRARR